MTQELPASGWVGAEGAEFGWSLSHLRHCRQTHPVAAKIFGTRTRAGQQELIADIKAARDGQRQAAKTFHEAMAALSDTVDGGRGEELPEIDDTPNDVEGANGERE